MAQSSGRMSPRQRMINLMYIVLTAMLALNVSSDVLQGFTQVEEGLSRTNANMARRNESIVGQLREFSERNPEKGLPWLNEAEKVVNATNALIYTVDSLKLSIVQAADGKDGDPANIRNRDDLEASSVIMLNPATLRGEQLRREVDDYRVFIGSLITDSVKREAVVSALSTQPETGMVQRLWEESKFENQPVVAAVTLLTKLQNDIRYAEGEALSSLLNNVDAGDVRVNRLNAFVIPRSRYVMRGGKYTANIVLAAVDTTARPAIFIGDRQLSDSSGIYEFTAASTGSFDYSGYLEVPHGDGTVTRHDFSSEYVVMEPTATVSATMMNVLYAGIDNPVSISVPGVPPTGVNATMTNGSLVRQGDHWVARPATVGQDAVISVQANIDGVNQTVSGTAFRVRALPDPTPYLKVGDTRYKGRGKALAKSALLGAKGIGAAIDDDMLNIEFKVKGFETIFYDSMGNALVERSDGASFSQRQLDSFRRLTSGKRFYISRVRAEGPDGVERVLGTLEVIVN